MHVHCASPALLHDSQRYERIPLDTMPMPDTVMGYLKPRSTCKIAKIDSQLCCALSYPVGAHQAAYHDELVEDDEP